MGINILTFVENVVSGYEVLRDPMSIKHPPKRTLGYDNPSPPAASWDTTQPFVKHGRASSILPTHPSSDLTVQRIHTLGKLSSGCLGNNFWIVAPAEHMQTINLRSSTWDNTYALSVLVGRSSITLERAPVTSTMRLVSEASA